MNTLDSSGDAPGQVLSDREQAILRFVTESFIETAGPIGSRTLARQYPQIGLSSASIRNTMSDLEERGFLDQPHTSAGRVPTEQGYRAFVDELMERPEPSIAEKQALKVKLARRMSDTEELLRESSRLLSRLTNLLGIVLSPKISDSILERLDLVALGSDRLMFVLSVRSGFVKTIVLECELDLQRRDLGRIVSMLNERLSGLTLEEIRQTCAQRVGDLDDASTGVVQLMVDESAVLFSEPVEGRLRYGGAQNIMDQPEFQETQDLRDLIELVEDERYAVHLLEEASSVQSPGSSDDRNPRRALVSIGSEHLRDRDAVIPESVNRYSIVTSPYQRGDAVGTVGVIGPMRMDYPRVVALVEGAARLMSRMTASA